MSEWIHKPDSNCPDAGDLDDFILSPGSVDEDRRNHFETCPFCKLVIEQRLSEIAEFGDFIGSHVSKADANNVESLNVVHLAIWPSPMEQDDEISRLAAQGRTSEAMPQSITLASSDESIMLKVVRDPHTRDLWLYLLGDDPTLYRQLLVRPFGMDKGFFTDSHGRINLGSVDFPVPEHYSAEVHTPKAVFTLAPKEPSSGGAEERILESAQGDKIRVRFTKLGQSRQIVIEIVHLADLSPTSPLKIAVRGEGQKEITMVSPISGTFAVDDFPTTDSMEIYLFQ